MLFGDFESRQPMPEAERYLGQHVKAVHSVVHSVYVEGGGRVGRNHDSERPFQQRRQAGQLGKRRIRGLGYQYWGHESGSLGLVVGVRLCDLVAVFGLLKCGS